MSSRNGRLVALEGSADTVVAQLGLLPTSPHILVLPSVEHYVASNAMDSVLLSPFNARQLIRIIHDAATARKEAALSFLETPTAMGPWKIKPKLVFLQGGTAASHALCIEMLRRHEVTTGGDVVQASHLFDELVAGGVAGLASAAGGDIGEGRESTSEEAERQEHNNTSKDNAKVDDTVNKVMRATDALDEENEALKSYKRMRGLTTVDASSLSSLRIRSSAQTGLEKDFPVLPLSRARQLKRVARPGAVDGRDDDEDADDTTTGAATNPNAPRVTPPSIQKTATKVRTATRSGAGWRASGSADAGPVYVNREAVAANAEEASIMTSFQPVLPLFEDAVVQFTGDNTMDVAMAAALHLAIDRCQYMAAGEDGAVRSTANGGNGRNGVRGPASIPQTALPATPAGSSYGPEDAEVADHATGAELRQEPELEPETEPELEPELPRPDSDDYDPFAPQVYNAGPKVPARLVPATASDSVETSAPSAAPEVLRPASKSAHITTTGAAAVATTEPANISPRLPTPAQTPLLDSSDKNDGFSGPRHPEFHVFSTVGHRSAVTTQNILRQLLNGMLPPDEAYVESSKENEPRTNGSIGSSTSKHHDIADNRHGLGSLLSYLEANEENNSGNGVDDRHGLWKPLLGQGSGDAHGGGKPLARHLDLVLAMGAQSGVPAQFVASVTATVAALGRQASGESSGRLNLSYLIANALNVHATQEVFSHQLLAALSEALQPSRSPGASLVSASSSSFVIFPPSHDVAVRLLAAVAVSQLDLYFMMHPAMRFVLLEFAAPLGPIAAAMKTLLGHDLMQTACFVQDGSSMNRRQRRNQKKRQKEDLAALFAGEADLVLASTAGEEQIAAFVSSVWERLAKAAPEHYGTQMPPASLAAMAAAKEGQTMDPVAMAMAVAPLTGQGPTVRTVLSAQSIAETTPLSSAATVTAYSNLTPTSMATTVMMSPSPMQSPTLPGLGITNGHSQHGTRDSVQTTFTGASSAAVSRTSTALVPLPAAFTSGSSPGNGGSEQCHVNGSSDSGSRSAMDDDWSRDVDQAYGIDEASQDPAAFDGGADEDDDDDDDDDDPEMRRLMPFFFRDRTSVAARAAAIRARMAPGRPATAGGAAAASVVGGNGDAVGRIGRGSRAVSLYDKTSTDTRSKSSRIMGVRADSMPPMPMQAGSGHGAVRSQAMYDIGGSHSNNGMGNVAGTGLNLPGNASGSGGQKALKWLGLA